MATLKQRLEALRAGIEKDAPAEIVDYIHQSTNDLVERVAQSPGLGAGDAMPPFRLPDQDGNEVDSAGLLKHGPLVLVLFRGHW
ncbi:MAG: hypothetical protein ACYTGN_12100 [Planctomycetota bacterium]|jgi:hypothetical protein